MSDTAMVEKLAQFVDNGGLVEKNKPPKPNEPFYDFYIEAMIRNEHINTGDDVIVITIDSESIVGKVIESPTVELCGLYILTSGKRKWKSGKNVRYVSMRRIAHVEKLATAEKSFNILDVNPEYIDVKKDTAENIPVSKEYDENFIKHFKDAYPNLRYDEMYSLCIHSNLYCPFTNADVVKGRVLLLTKDDEMQMISDLKLKHIYPNRNYYDLCDKQPYSEYIIIPFASKKELNNIRCVATFWTALIDDVPVHILEMSYVSFEDGEGRIYNVSQRSTFLDVHYDSLFQKTVFSGDIFAAYDTTAVILNEDAVHYIQKDDKNNESEMLDVILASHEGSLTKILMSLCEETQVIKYIEVYIARNTIKGKTDAIDMHGVTENWYENLRKKLNFQRLFKKDDIVL